MKKGDEIYLSRLLLNQSNREVGSDASDCHRLHQRILIAFPKVECEGQKARERFGVLHRLDQERRLNRLILLVQSNLKPDWNALPPGYLLDSSEENPACKPVHEKYAALQDGQHLLFRLRANPTRRVHSRNEREHTTKFHGKRVDIRGEEAQIEWLQRKAQTNGFELGEVRINLDVLNLRTMPEGRITGRRKVSTQAESSNPLRLTFGSVLFEGELRVTDVELFRNVLVEGIGSGKAYGFGLLSLAPAGGAL